MDSIKLKKLSMNAEALEKITRVIDSHANKKSSQDYSLFTADFDNIGQIMIVFDSEDSKKLNELKLKYARQFKKLLEQNVKDLSAEIFKKDSA
jgi:cobalamin biosynthesis protein CobT